MTPEEKVILYDSPEAAKYVTNIEGWVSAEKHFYGKGEFAERSARNDGCTHKKCECGELFKKEWAYTVCEKCVRKKAYERFLKLPYQEWNEADYVLEYDGDTFFWDIESLQEYMCENELEEIDLYICSPIMYDTIDTETIAGDSHEDWEPSAELEKKINEFNDYIRTLKPHSWGQGKIRTSYKLPEEIKKEYSE